jgi:hypothetical protein
MELVRGATDLPFGSTTTARIRDETMFDEMDRLRGVQGLLNLLNHYAELGRTDRQIWQDRLSRLDGVEPRELVKFHGELIAFGWIEQNTGATPILRHGAAPACYRVTLAGIRALQQVLIAAADTNYCSNSHSA